MAKQKITVTVDADLVDAIREDDTQTLSGVMNDALAGEVARRARRRALRAVLERWERELGPIPADDVAFAIEVFADADGLCGAA